MASDSIVRILRQTAEAEGFRYIVERHTLSEAADEIESLHARLAAEKAARIASDNLLDKRWVTIRELVAKLAAAELLWQTAVDNEGTQWAEDIVAAAKEVGDARD